MPREVFAGEFRDDGAMVIRAPVAAGASMDGKVYAAVLDIACDDGSCVMMLTADECDRAAAGLRELAAACRLRGQ